MTYQLGPIIAKISGSAKAESIPVYVEAPRLGDYVMYTLHIPAGEKWLVILAGQLQPMATSRSVAPQLQIGDTTSVNLVGTGTPGAIPPLDAGFAAECTGTTQIALLRRDGGAGTSFFSGHVYTVPLPD